jgi:hypothetical protein
MLTFLIGAAVRRRQDSALGRGEGARSPAGEAGAPVAPA